jgi:hypothetical protein
VQPLSVKQLGAWTAAYVAVAAGAAWLLAAIGKPELAPAALIGQALLVLALFVHSRVPARAWRPYLWPGLAVAGLAVAGPAYVGIESPWALTPTFLAPELPIPVLGSSLGERLETKVRLTGQVRWWDEYPYGTGLADPLKVRIENETGAIDVILDRAALERELAAGQVLRLVARVGTWEGGIPRVVALSVVLVDPAP